MCCEPGPMLAAGTRGRLGFVTKDISWLRNSTSTKRRLAKYVTKACLSRRISFLLKKEVAKMSTEFCLIVCLRKYCEFLPLNNKDEIVIVCYQEKYKINDNKLKSLEIVFTGRWMSVGRDFQF